MVGPPQATAILTHSARRTSPDAHVLLTQRLTLYGRLLNHKSRFHFHWGRRCSRRIARRRSRQFLPLRQESAYNVAFLGPVGVGDGPIDKFGFEERVRLT